MASSGGVAIQYNASVRGVGQGWRTMAFQSSPLSIPTISLRGTIMSLTLTFQIQHRQEHVLDWWREICERDSFTMVRSSSLAECTDGDVGFDTDHAHRMRVTMFNSQTSGIMGSAAVPEGSCSGKPLFPGKAQRWF